MWLRNLSILNFKNYDEASLEFLPEVNVLAGYNGSGKTNILDAIHYLSLCKSYFNPIDSQQIKLGTDWFMVQGNFEKDEIEYSIACSLKRNQKKVFKKDKKEYSRLADHIGLFPLVMISPADSSIVMEGSEERRKFMDNVISQTDASYLDSLIAYNRSLLQRNTVLKQVGRSGSLDLHLLEVLDMQLVEYGQLIYEKRKAFIAQFLPEFERHYSFLTEGAEQVNLSYDSQLHVADFSKLLSANYDRDRILERTSVGIHKDDLIFTIHDQFQLKKFGSQGQQKSFLIALKLAQYTYFRNIKGFKPLLLLDDIFDKLDDRRVRKLMEMVSNEEFGQLFITDTDAQRIQEIFKGISTNIRYFAIHQGKAQLDESRC